MNYTDEELDAAWAWFRNSDTAQLHLQPDLCGQARWSVPWGMGKHAWEVLGDSKGDAIVEAHRCYLEDAQ